MKIARDRLIGQCHADQEFVFQLARALKCWGLKVWIDQWNIPPSADWDKSIDEALDRCTRLLIILSAAAVESDEVRSELHTALSQNKPVVPILYKQCRKSRRLRLIQHIDFRSRNVDDKSAIEDIICALTSTNTNT